VGRQVGVDERLILISLVAFDTADLEAAFLVSRNHTILIAVLLLVVGGTAIYFLFLAAGYRSAQTALANMRSYTTNVIESMASGLVSVDADGHVVTVNSKARDLLGLEGSDTEGVSLGDVLTVEPAGVERALDEVLEGSRKVVESEAALLLDGERVPVSLSASSLFDEGARRSGTVVLFQDLREIEELKAEVERAKHLAAIGRLAAGVAHEVRNPLSSLKGFAQFLRGKFQPGSDEERYSDIMIEEVERLDRVVQELLDFARPVEAVRKPVDPNSLVAESLALVSEDAGFRDVTIVRRLADGLPDVYVDQFQMRQVLLNLMLNAMEAMSGGGSLTVESALESDGGERPQVCVSVSDTGPGMAEEELEKLFEPFYTTKQEGTGLGLTIVSRLVEQNGGRVSVRSTQGEGTTFSLRLPTSPGGDASAGGGSVPRRERSYAPGAAGAAETGGDAG
jgi:two-component system sensor histidine kinase HydH